MSPATIAKLEAAGIYGPGALEVAERLAPEVYAQRVADAEPAPESSPREREILDLRASAMPAAFLCPGSIRRPVVRIREEGEAANLGSAVHEALRPLVEDGAAAFDRVSDLAEEYGCDPDELRMLISCGAKLWKQVEASFPNAVTEQPMKLDLGDGYVLTGTTDLISGTSESLRLGDWKSGRKDSDYSNQMRAYGAMALLGWPTADAPESATVTALWLRTIEAQNYTITRDAAIRWLDELRDRVIQWDGIYHPGAHCTYCRRAHECEARSALVRRSIADVLGGVSSAQALEAMAPDQILDLHQRATLILGVADQVRKAIKAHVEMNGDVVGTDQRLTITTENRRRLQTVPAFEVLSALGFRDPEWAECVEIKLSKAEAIVKEKAPKRGGAAAIRDLQDKLEAADAVRTFEIRKLTTKRG